MRIITNHPNAIVGGLLGAGGIGQVALWLLNDQGIQLSERQGAAVAAITATVILAAGRTIKYAYRHGAIGVWNVVLHGKAGPGSAASAAETSPVAGTIAADLAAELDTANARIAELEAEKQAAATTTVAPPTG